MGKQLSDEQIQQYEHDGVLFPIPVLSVDEVQHYAAAVDELGSLVDEGVKRFDNVHRFFHWAYRLATNPAVIDAVSDVLGDDLLIDGTLIFCKHPRDPAYVSWHQDSVYSGWHLTPSISAWIALSASTRQNGCMRVIPGSHHMGLLQHAEKKSRNNLLRRGEEVQIEVDEAAAVDLLLRPGEMSLHNSNIVHGSNPNDSDEPRIGFIVRFVTSRITNRGQPLMRAHGMSPCAHLELVPPPAERDMRQSLADWSEFDRGRQRDGARSSTLKKGASS